jgi:hypothetical protein
MEKANYRQALFTGLIYNEAGQPVETTCVGTEPHYVILDDDFKRHVAAEEVDRQVVNWLQEQAEANKEMVSAGLMTMLGQDDLFTKAMIDSSLTHMDRVMEQGLPEDARTMLGMLGFKIIVNTHGEVINLEMPGQSIDDE